MMIKKIFIAKESSAEQEPFNKVCLTAKNGIVGDRYYSSDKCPEKNISLIEIEEINAYNEKHKQQIKLNDTRRNIITQGIRLNELVNKTFYIGAVEFFGTELCEPCAELGDRLKTASMSKQDVIKAFTHKGGLRATIITDGILEIGMAFTLSSPSTLDSHNNRQHHEKHQIN